MQAKLPERLKENFSQFAGRTVAKTDRTDGLQLIFDDGSWVLMRPSGTEAGRKNLRRSREACRRRKTGEDAQTWITK